jgi:predicted phage terminase large subunit-like protein
MTTSEFDMILRTDFYTFARHAHSELRGNKLSYDPYLLVIADDVKCIVSGKISRYACNIPPGYGKTFNYSVAMPAWALGHHPSLRLLVVSYNEDLAKDIARDIRAILRGAFYRRAFPRTVLADDHQAARDFATTAGGRVFATSIDGGTTGRRCDILIIDDPVAIQNCNDTARLADLNHRFSVELESRLNNPMQSAIVIVHHRLNRDDLTGYVLKRPGWTHRVLPLVADETTEYTLSNGRTWTRRAGELLRPEALSQERLKDLRDNCGPPGFGPLYQQTFVGPNVLQLRREDFVIEQFYQWPNGSFVFSVDLNHRGEVGRSFCVVQAWTLLNDGRFMLYDRWRARAHYSFVAQKIYEMAREYRPTAILIEQDNAHAFDLAEKLTPLDVHVELIEQTVDKVGRLRGVIDLFRNRRIVLPRGKSFVESFIAELVAFPYGDFDDQVDAATLFLNWIMCNELPAKSKRQRGLAATANRAQIRERLYFKLMSGQPSGPYVVARRRR